MNPAIKIRAEWDGNFTLIVDGKVVLERRPRAEIQEKAAFIDTALAVESLRKAGP